MTGIGALLVILSGSMIGISAAREIKQCIRRTEDVCKAVSHMKTLVLLRHYPLLRVTEELESSDKRLFKGLHMAVKKDPDVPFSLAWNAYVFKMGLPSGVARSLGGLGAALSRGDPPETAFEAASGELKNVLTELRSRERDSSRLMIALGASCGCLIALFFL